jgi:hypothetical protein
VARSRHTWLINKAVETSLQFPESREMIIQLREASLAGEKRTFKIRELDTTGRVGFAFLDLREKGHH